MDNQQAPAQVMSTGDWIITLLISSLPLIGFIMLFVWAFGSGENPNKANWAKAMLIWTVILVGLFCLIWIVFLGAFFGAMQSQQG